jgi:hypothetical protein
MECVYKGVLSRHKVFSSSAQFNYIHLFTVYIQNQKHILSYYIPIPPLHHRHHAFRCHHRRPRRYGYRSSCGFAGADWRGSWYVTLLFIKVLSTLTEGFWLTVRAQIRRPGRFLRSSRSIPDLQCQLQPACPGLCLHYQLSHRVLLLSHCSWHLELRPGGRKKRKPWLRSWRRWFWPCVCFGLGSAE